MKVCAYDACGVNFEPKTHNQRYHTSDCCRQATNARIMEDYYARKARRKGNIRHCNSCDTVLSRYNDSRVCSVCEASEKNAERFDLLRMLSVAV